MRTMPIVSERELISANDLAYLKRQLSIGEVILFTGAGFSSGCVGRNGRNLPLGSELRKLIWPHAFPGDDFADTESLADIFQVALKKNPGALRATLDAALSVDP